MAEAQMIRKSGLSLSSLAKVRQSLGAENVILVIAVLVILYLALTPILMLLYTSFRTTSLVISEETFTLTNYVDAYTDPEFLPLFANSFIYASGVCIVGTLIGTALAWVCERTNTPLRSLFSVLALTTYVVPGVLNAIAWLLLLSPRIGLINVTFMDLLKLPDAPLNLYSLPGMIWVASVHLYPVMFLMMSVSMKSMDSSLEEAAWVSGSSVFATIRKITLRSLRPALLSGLLLLFIRGIESFEVPALVGVPANIDVFTTKIFLALSNSVPPKMGLASALAVMLFVIGTAGVYFYRRTTAQAEKFATITGRGFRPRQIDLGPWRYVMCAFWLLFFGLTLFLPTVILFWVSLLPRVLPPTVEVLDRISLDQYAFALSYPTITRAFRNSFLLAVASATGVMLLTAVISWISLRSKVRGKWLLDVLTFLPITIPAIIMGVSLLFVFLILPLPVYGTLFPLFIAYITLFMPYGIRIMSATIIQIHKELEEAALVSGASWLRMFRRVVLPLLLPGMLAGWLYVVVIAIRELSASIFLVTEGTEVLSTVTYNLWAAGHMTSVAALGILITVFLAVLTTIVQRMYRRLGVTI